MGDEVDLHLLPASIVYNGNANVRSYFQPSETGSKRVYPAQI